MKPGVPESFRVLVKELQGLGLDVEVQFDDGTHGDIPIEDDERPMFTGRPPEIFSSPRKPRKPRAKPQQTQEEDTDILSAPANDEQEILPEIADMLFESAEPTAEDLENMTDEPELFADPDSIGEGDI